MHARLLDLGHLASVSMLYTKNYDCVMAKSTLLSYMCHICTLAAAQSEHMLSFCKISAELLIYCCMPRDWPREALLYFITI